MSENEMLRKEFRDPRVHFAIVCASGMSCFARGGLCSRPTGGPVGRPGQDLSGIRGKSGSMRRPARLYVSPIFKWFKEDFASAGNDRVSPPVSACAPGDFRRHQNTMAGL